MWEPFEQTLKKYQELEQQLADPAIASDRIRYARAAKEHGALTKQVKPYLEYKKVSDDLAQVEAMIAAEADADSRGYFEEEQKSLAARKQILQDKLEELLLIDPSEDYDSVIMEIRAGTGGDEAAIFAGDLYNMYTHYARDHGWKVEDITFSGGEQGGYKEVVLNIAGEDVFRFLRYESGAHRVQRVPKTETQGRIHTSTATVAVLPEPDDVQVEIKDQDIEWEKMRAGGAGGQHVNKTESAVRIWYKKGTPEEMEVKCQDERSQHKNYDRAMRILRTRLFERQQQRLHQSRAEQRRTLIGSGDRSEKIRTYNYPQNRVTDHRIGLTLYRLDSIVAGDLAEMLQGLRDFDRKQRLGDMTPGKDADKD
ncbi:peptide chain release factor 1 [Planctomycetaceae bacterium SCGC AG-212-D15]|nr:peptide chain release factor 1 [Planctomycetaceae bacterium SCGC AG-212-D15]